MTSPHQPVLPSWRCAACGGAWRCLLRRDELATESEGGRAELALLMARYFNEAIEDHPSNEVGALYTRFFGWVHWRRRDELAQRREPAQRPTEPKTDTDTDSGEGGAYGMDSKNF